MAEVGLYHPWIESSEVLPTRDARYVVAWIGSDEIQLMKWSHSIGWEAGVVRRDPPWPDFWMDCPELPPAPRPTVEA